MEKIGRYFIYDYYYVPKYILTIVYLNKPTVAHNGNTQMSIILLHYIS